MNYGLFVVFIFFTLGLIEIPALNQQEQDGVRRPVRYGTKKPKKQQQQQQPVQQEAEKAEESTEDQTETANEEPTAEADEGKKSDGNFTLSTSQCKLSLEQSEQSQGRT